jgi:hypothetical protein
MSDRMTMCPVCAGEGRVPVSTPRALQRHWEGPRERLTPLRARRLVLSSPRRSISSMLKAMGGS